MSGQASGWVLNHGPHPDHVGADGRRYGPRARGLRMVLLAVADSANMHGEHSHPGFDNVARCALYSRRQAITLLAQLVEDGWLEVEQKGGGAGLATVYRLPRMKQEKGAMAAPKESKEGCNMEEKTVQYDPETVQSRLHPNGISNVDTQPGEREDDGTATQGVEPMSEETRAMLRDTLAGAKPWTPPREEVG